MPTIEEIDEQMLNILFTKLDNPLNERLAQDNLVPLDTSDFESYGIKTIQFYESVIRLEKKKWLIPCSFVLFSRDKKNNAVVLTDIRGEHQLYHDSDFDDVDWYAPYQVEVAPDFKSKYEEHLLKKKKDKIKEKAVVKLPEGTTWEDITIKILDKYTIEVLAKKKFMGKYTCDVLGMGKGKEKEPTKQWDLLVQLSFPDNQIRLNKLPNIKSSGSETLNSIKIARETERLKKQIQLLTEKLQEIFGLRDDDPFFDYEDYDYYKPRFKLLPVPELRETREEIRGVKDEYTLQKDAGGWLLSNDDISSDEEPLPEENDEA